MQLNWQTGPLQFQLPGKERNLRSQKQMKFNSSAFPQLQAIFSPTLRGSIYRHSNQHSTINYPRLHLSRLVYCKRFWNTKKTGQNIRPELSNLLLACEFSSDLIFLRHTLLLYRGCRFSRTANRTWHRS